MKYGAEEGKEAGRRKKEDKNMEGRSRVRRHEITKNEIDVEIRDPYRYRSVPLSFERYIAKSARKTAFFRIGQNEWEKLQCFLKIACCFKNNKLNRELDIMSY